MSEFLTAIKAFLGGASVWTYFIVAAISLAGGNYLRGYIDNAADLKAQNQQLMKDNTQMVAAIQIYTEKAKAADSRATDFENKYTTLKNTIGTAKPKLKVIYAKENNSNCDVTASVQFLNDRITAVNSILASPASGIQTEMPVHP